MALVYWKGRRWRKGNKGKKEGERTRWKKTFSLFRRRRRRLVFTTHIHLGVQLSCFTTHRKNQVTIWKSSLFMVCMNTWKECQMSHRFMLPNNTKTLPIKARGLPDNASSSILATTRNRICFAWNGCSKWSTPGILSWSWLLRQQ